MKNNNEKAANELVHQDKKLPRPRKLRMQELVNVPLNDGMNTLLPDKIETPVADETEAALFKQAANPLGNPDQV